MKILKTETAGGVFEYRQDPKIKGRCDLEEIEAINFFAHVQAKYPGLIKAKLFFHVASEGVASLHRRGKLKQAGLLPGVADYLLLVPRGKFNYMALELKRANPSASKVSEDQTSFLKSCVNAGGFACVCYGWRAAIAAIDEYMALQSI